jgi:hypothetical protein
MDYFYVQALQLEAELGAITRSDYDRAFLITWGGEALQSAISGSAPFRRMADQVDYVYPHGVSVKGHERSTDGAVNVVPLSDSDIASLRENAHAVVEKTLQANQGEWVPLRDVGQIKDFLTLPFWLPQTPR